MCEKMIPGSYQAKKKNNCDFITKLMLHNLRTFYHMSRDFFLFFFANSSNVFNVRKMCERCNKLRMRRNGRVSAFELDTILSFLAKTLVFTANVDDS